MDNKVLHDYLKKSLDKIRELKSQLEAHREPIAIVGMACRYPGGAVDPDKLWQLIETGTDCITDIPSSRWDVDKYYDSNKETPGKMYTKKGGFLKEDVALFDNTFFGISDAEANDMDPQQRLALEVTWHALEDAGIAPESCKKTKTGVFLGVSFNDYGQLLRGSKDPNTLGKYGVTGNHFSVISGRISYYFGLQGPALTFDTACSSSLVAIRSACQELRLHTCDMALAGGVNLVLSPESMILACKAGMLSQSGHCKTLDKEADGFTRGEGCGVLVLKRLSDAISSQDRILGVIYGAAVNQNGASTTLTAPNGLAQKQVLQSALAEAGKLGKDISYVELHGTGTSLGDQIEVESITEVYGKDRDKESPLILGTVKTNIGHTETASGVAGIIKVLLAFRHDKIPSNLCLTTLNPNIDLSRVPAIYPQEVIPWNAQEGERFAAVSAFGFSGSNAHVILGDGAHVLPPTQKEAEKTQRPLHLVTLSAKSPTALQQLVDDYIVYLAGTPENLANIAYTTNVGRNHFDHRMCILARDLHELKHKLSNKEYQVAACGKEKKIKITVERSECSNFTLSNVSSSKINVQIGPQVVWTELLQAIADLYLKNGDIDWSAVNKPFAFRRVALPTYPFNGKRHWFC